MIITGNSCIRNTGTGFTMFTLEQTTKPSYNILMMPLNSMGYPHLEDRVELVNTGNPITMRPSHLILDSISMSGERILFTNIANDIGGHPKSYRSPTAATTTATQTATAIQNAVTTLGTTHSYDLIVYLKIKTSDGSFVVLPKYRILDWTYRSFHDDWAQGFGPGDNDSHDIDPHAEWTIGLSHNDTTNNQLIPYSYDEERFVALTTSDFKRRMLPLRYHILKDDTTTYGGLPVSGTNGVYYNAEFSYQGTYYTIQEGTGNAQGNGGFSDSISTVYDKTFFYIGLISSHVDITTLPPPISLDRNNALQQLLWPTNSRLALEAEKKYYVDEKGNEYNQDNANSESITILIQAGIDFDNDSKLLIPS